MWAIWSRAAAISAVVSLPMRRSISAITGPVEGEGDDRGDAVPIAVTPVDVGDALELGAGERREAEAALFTRRIRREMALERELAGELGMCADQGELSGGRKSHHRSAHRPMEAIDGVVRRIESSTMHGFGDLRRVLVDVAELLDEERAMHA
jgi:hypothetical protein